MTEVKELYFQHNPVKVGFIYIDVEITLFSCLKMVSKKGKALFSSMSLVNLILGCLLLRSLV